MSESCFPPGQSRLSRVSGQGEIQEAISGIDEQMHLMMIEEVLKSYIQGKERSFEV